MIQGMGDIRCIILMSQESEEEGFFKPKVSVCSPIKSTRAMGGGDGEQAKELVAVARPLDFGARMLLFAGPFHMPPIETRQSKCKEQLIPLTTSKIKLCKYHSLKEKYHHNELYQQVYCRREDLSYGSYFFNLQATYDYNPKYYVLSSPPRASQSVFDSRFEGGNLLYAYKHTKNFGDPTDVSYDLLMQDDTNTHGYNQWFFFSYRVNSPHRVHFNIVNFVKKHLLFEDGVRPVALTIHDKHESSNIWYSIGSQMTYQKSYVLKDGVKSYYTLSFKVDFIETGTTYIALNYPYTYTMVMDYIRGLNPHPNVTIDRSILCYTISNNAVPCVRIKHKEKKHKKQILVLARQHPGESVGSFVLEGFVNKIILQERIFNTYQIIVIPMVNPDGVIYGNFRTNLAGFDLNRQWQEPNKSLHPEIYSIARLIDTLDSLHFVIDFHGHSKKWNSFAYACTGQRPVDLKVYPYLYSKVCPLFSLKDSTFNITADKLRTARVTIHQQLNLPFVYTIQTSFFGYTQGQAKVRYEISDLHSIGEGAFESMRLLLCDKAQLKMAEKEVREMEHLFAQWATQNREDPGSQSNPSEDQLTALERNQRVMALCQNTVKKIKKKKRNVSHPTSTTIIPKKEELKPVEIIEKKQVRKKEVERKIEKPKVNYTSVQQIRKESLTTSRREIEKAKLYLLKQPTMKGLNKIKIDLSTRKKKSIQAEMKTVKVQQPQKKSDSNLFNTSNFYSQMQSRLEESRKQTEQRRKMQQNGKLNFAQRTYSLEISSNKHIGEASETSNKTKTATIIRKLMPLDEGRRREKLCVVQENDRSDQEIKKTIERQIHNRTAALRNCQKKMRQITVECETMLGVKNRPYKLIN